MPIESNPQQDILSHNEPQIIRIPVHSQRNIVQILLTPELEKIIKMIMENNPWIATKEEIVQLLAEEYLHKEEESEQKKKKESEQNIPSTEKIMEDLKNIEKENSWKISHEEAIRQLLIKYLKQQEKELKNKWKNEVKPEQDNYKLDIKAMYKDNIQNRKIKRIKK